MSAVADFMNQFDEDGRYESGDGVLQVILVDARGRQHKGELHFNKGLCVLAMLEGFSPWKNPDDSPLKEIHFLLHFDGETPHAILINEGRVVQQYDKGSIKG